jgi:Fe-S cluster assembly iron-binding protein IscA
MITITPEAAAEIARRLEGQPPSVGVRIFVRGFG